MLTVNPVQFSKSRALLSNWSAIRYAGGVTTTTGLRARVRAELLEEIKRLSREQIARAGPTSLSLRAVARELGMASSAVYRYYPSRDQLLTALIIDSYDALGVAIERADALVERTDLPNRWRAIATALRAWAMERPSEYALLFGTPVPGYAAPTDTIGPATRYSAVLLSLLVDIHAAAGAVARRPPAGRGRRTATTGASAAPGGAVAARAWASWASSASGAVTPELTAQYDILRLRVAADLPDGLLLRGLAAWMNLFGAISFELFGHLHNVIDDPGVHYAALVELIGERVLGPAWGGTLRPHV